MAKMCSTPLRFGVKLVGQQGRALLTPRVTIFDIRCAGISSKTLRGEGMQKPKPWPYKEVDYNNFRAFFDHTTKRLGENSKLILVEGPPAVGKTEVIETLAKEFEMKAFPRVTMDNHFINDYGYDLRQMDSKLPKSCQSYDVDLYIKNPKHDHVPALQFTFYKYKLIQYMDALAHVLNTGEGVILERSVYSDLVFLESMFSQGHVDKWERKGYYYWRKRTIDAMMKPHLVIYLDASTDTITENLKRRGKGEEKVYNNAFLEKLEENYKHQFLQTISEHAEVLVYDWNIPGDPEVMVEDIEAIDFEQFSEPLEPKMADWRLKEEWDWNEKRWTYSSHFSRNQILGSLHCSFLENCPRLYINPEESKFYDDVMEEYAPGMRYDSGYNPEQGDNILLKWKNHPFGVKHEKRGEAAK